uniref:Non-structural protein 5 n=1 Tax=Rotavirus B (isolate RVB/Rat/United States/IDIR/1984/G1P[X]) TaxID=28877 RepID=NSP5_ROTGI|nr:RecName: Full=Non-structural protein 5; Short=NSP5; AltName: Full=NS26 [IDIR agent]BAA00758.1 ORF [IDIR agent]
MAEASEFNFNLRRKSRAVTASRRVKEEVKEKQKMDDSKSQVVDVDSVSVYSHESSRSNYSDAYEKLKREPVVEESNDARYRTFEFSEDEETFKPANKMSDKSQRNSKSKHTEGLECSDTVLEKISELTLEIEKVKQMNQPITVDAAFNMTLRNVDNLTTRQKQALVNSIINSMN